MGVQAAGFVEQVRLCGEDCIELVEQVKVKDGRVGQGSGDCVERDELCRLRCGF
jgi:hypothetical protein